MRHAGVVLLMLVTASGTLAQTGGIRTCANPLDDYRHDFEQLKARISCRSGADPVIVSHRGAYDLFLTVWGDRGHSNDPLHWRFVTSSRWLFEDVVAPAAISVGDVTFLMMSACEPRPILYTTAPESRWVEFYDRLLPQLPTARTQEADTAGLPVTMPPRRWHPDRFRDPDTARWYLYRGSSSVIPLQSLEHDPEGRR